MEISLALYDALLSVNIPAEKAKAVVVALEKDMEHTLATKQDLLLLKTELKCDFVSMEQRLISLEQRMTIKLGAMLVLVVGALAAIIKL